MFPHLGFDVEPVCLLEEFAVLALVAEDIVPFLVHWGARPVPRMVPENVVRESVQVIVG